MKKRIIISLVIVLMFCICYGCGKPTDKQVVSTIQEESSNIEQIVKEEETKSEQTQTITEEANEQTENSELVNTELCSNVEDKGEDPYEKYKVTVKELKERLINFGDIDICCIDSYYKRQKLFDIATNDLDVILYMDRKERKNAFEIHITDDSPGYRAIISDPLDEGHEFTVVLNPCAIYLNSENNIVIEGSDYHRKYYYYEFDGKKLKEQKEEPNVDFDITNTNTNSKIIYASTKNYYGIYGSAVLDGDVVSFYMNGDKISSTNIPIPQKVIPEKYWSQQSVGTAPYIDMDNRMILLKTYNEDGEYNINSYAVAENVDKLIGMFANSGTYFIKGLDGKYYAIVEENGYTCWYFPDKEEGSSIDAKVKIKEITHKELNECKKDIFYLGFIK